jgi:mono/diheme cytochrome c family protein
MTRLSRTVCALVVALSAAGIAAATRAEPNAYALYALRCMGCHQSDGAGIDTVPKLRDFVGNFLHVAGGREFLVQVPGVAQSSLTDAEIASVLNWILTEFSNDQLPADFQPYSGDEVARYRPGRLIDVDPVRAQLIADMRARKIIE